MTWPEPTCSAGPPVVAMLRPPTTEVLTTVFTLVEEVAVAGADDEVDVVVTGGAVVGVEAELPVVATAVVPLDEGVVDVVVVVVVELGVAGADVELDVVVVVVVELEVAGADVELDVVVAGGAVVGVGVELEVAGTDAAVVVVVLPDEVVVVGLVADVPFAFTSNASTQTQVPPEEELLVPVTSMARVWLPEARPVTEYTFACA